MASKKKNSKSSSPSSIRRGTAGKTRYAICLDNDGHPASLERGKLYQVLPDVAAAAAAHGLLRVVDEDGEDYAYEAGRFFPVTIPRTLERRLSQLPAVH